MVAEAWDRRIFPLWQLSHAGGAVSLFLVPGRVDGVGSTPGLGQRSWAGAGTAVLGLESPMQLAQCPLERSQRLFALGDSWDRGAAGSREAGKKTFLQDVGQEPCAGRGWHRERGLCPQRRAPPPGERNVSNGTSMVAGSPAVMRGCADPDGAQAVLAALLTR